VTRAWGRRRSPSRVIVPKRAQAARERLAFGLGPDTVPGRGLVEAALAREVKPTFATAAYAEPRDWGFGGLMAFTAVLLLRPQDTFPVLNPLHLAESCAIIGLAPMILHRITQRLPVFRITPETVGLMVLGGVMLGTAPFSFWPGGAIDVFINAYLKILLVFILMMNTLTTPKRIDGLLWLIVLCFGYIAGRSFIDYARGVHLIENGRLAGPVGGIFGNPNDLALNMVTFAPAAALMAWTRRYSRTRRVTAALIAVLMVGVVVLTKSRGGSIGLVVAIVILAVLGRKVRRGMGTVAIVSLLIATPFMPQSFWTRMSTIIDDREDQKEFTGSREARRILIEEGIKAFVDNPLTGVGAGQFQNYNPPGRREPWRETHNVLVQVAADLGAFGLAAFVYLIMRGMLAAARARRLLDRSRRRDPADLLDVALSRDDQRTLYLHAVAMTAGLIGWFTCALFASVAYSWTFYYPLAIVVAIYELTRDRLVAAKAIASGIGAASARITPFRRTTAGVA
jgi:O-antigen ligase